MIDGDLHEAYRQFEDDLLLDADFTGEPQHMCFFKLFSEAASENGDTADLDYTPARRPGRGGYQVDGYALDLNRGELFLAVCDFRRFSTIQSINAAPLEAMFQRVGAFFHYAVEPKFIRELEETSPAFEAAYPIHKNLRKIKRIRIILLTNAVLAVRKRSLSTDAIHGIPVTYNVLDFARYVNILKSQGSAEPITIDVSPINGKPLPCLQAHVQGTSYKSYLVILPGTFVADIYGLYGARLLEQNVRVFLQARTKVNRGIIDTVRKSPEMFFAYNNGLTATASDVGLQRLPDGNLGIHSFTNLQIVNGGQTTASILYAKDQSRADLSRVFVQMKLSVVEPESIEEIVPRISRFANTQNRVSEADFFSNHPFHIEMEQLSRRISAPPKAGSLAPTKWFYERARGQYKSAGAYGSESERKRFHAEYPKNKVVNKTDLAKYATTFQCVPHVVSRGAQKCFLEFAEDVSTAWDNCQDQFNDDYFRSLMAMALVFRETDRIVGQSEWYRADRGFKANIVTYAIAWLVYHLQERLSRSIDLQTIWNRQEMPEELRIPLSTIAQCVSEAIKDTPQTARNVSEYAKKQECWARISQLEIPLNTDFHSSTVNLREVRKHKKQSVSQARFRRQVDFDRDLVALKPRISEIREFAETRRLLSPKSTAALSKVEKLELPLSKHETNALNHLFRVLREKGLDLSVR